MDIVEQPTNQHRAVGLRRQRIHNSIRTRARAKRRIERTIRIQPREPRARRAVDLREITTEQNLSVAQHEHRHHRPVQHRRERCIQRTVRVQPRQKRLTHAVDRRETSAHEHLPVRLNSQRVTNVAQARAHIERKVESAVRAEARDAIDVRPVDGREVARDDHAAVRLDTQRRHHSIRANARRKHRIHAAHAVIVHDAYRRRARVADHRAARRRVQRDRECLVVFREQILRDRHRHRLVRHAGEERHHHRRRRVILTRDGRAVRRRERHAHADVRRARAVNRNLRRTRALAHAVERRAQLHRHVVVLNRQHRRRVRAQHRAAARSAEE